MKLFKKLLSPRLDVATVHIEKMQKWIDLQFKPILQTTHDQLVTNVESCQSYAQQLTDSIENLNNYSLQGEKIHVQTMATEHRKQYVLSLKDLIVFLKKEVSTGSIQSIYEFYERLREILEEVTKTQKKISPTLTRYIGHSYTHLTQLILKVQMNYDQAQDIFDSLIYKKYLSISANIKSYFEKLKKRQAFLHVKNKLRVTSHTQEELMKKTQRKINRISEDPRFKMEKEYTQSADSRYKHSYYEMEMIDLQSKVKQQRRQLKLIEKKMQEIDQRIHDLGIQNELRLIQRKAYEQFNIEVEILE